jgi:DNA-binding NarL/FixJ family response regulator
LQNILLVQIDSVHAIAVRDALIHSNDGDFRVIWLTTCCDALNHLADMSRPAPANEPIAGVLLDIFLPDSTGIETFDCLFHAAPQIPILILTAARDENIAKLAVQRGAQEYLLKDRLDAYLLPKAVRSMIERAANTEALFAEKERAQVTLNSIGDAVISTDVSGKVTYLNVVGPHAQLCSDSP